MTVTEISSEGLATCELIVTDELTNNYSTLHGGAIATIVDVVGTIALLGIDPTRAGGKSYPLEFSPATPFLCFISTPTIPLLYVSSAHLMPRGTDTQSLHLGLTLSSILLVCFIEVSIEMNQTFLSAARAGDKIILLGFVLKYGRRLGFTQVTRSHDRP